MNINDRAKSCALVLLCSCTLMITKLPSSAWGYGTTGAQILNLNSSAKITAMGNANAGLSDDLNAIVYNPAGLTQIFGTQLQFTRLIYFLDTGMSSMTFGREIGKAVIAFKWKFFKAEDTYRDSLGYNEKKFDIKYSQYTLGIGCPVFDRHSAGIGVNIISENYGLGSVSQFGKDKKDSTIGFDIGWLYRGYRGDSFGAVVRNLGGSIKVDKAKIKLPLKYVFGGSHKMGRFLFVWDVFTSRQVKFGWQCGLQADVKGLKVRSGFMYITDPDITIGFGLPYRNWSVDYAFFPHQDLGVAHRISLKIII